MSCCNQEKLVIKAGDDEVIPFTVTDTDADGTVTPVNLTGATIYLAIEEQGNSTLKVDIAQTSHTAPTDGSTSITIPRATTVLMTPDAPHSGVLRMKSAGGLITTIGEFEVEVTRSISTRDD